MPQPAISLPAFFFLCITFLASHAQVSTDPRLPTPTGTITITFDATKGSGNLEGHTGDLYAHTGVRLDSGRQWQYVIGQWGDNNVQPKLTRVGANLYELVISPDIHGFYGVPADSTITGLNLVFRASSNAPQTEDLFVEVVQDGLSVSIHSPAGLQPMYEPGEQVVIEAATNQADSLALFINQLWITSTNETSLSYPWEADSYGQQSIKVIAYGDDGNTATDELLVFVRPPSPVAALPDGLLPGITYHDEHTVSLVLHDPPALKQFAFVIGDMNDWQLTEEHYMYRTPDGSHYWITLDHLEAGVEYGFQYYIDGNFRMADPYAHKILDPWNDTYIDEGVYPGLKPYPVERTRGLVSILHPGREAYTWKTTGFSPPPVEDMVVYELLIRDFTDAGTIKAVMDSLDYLENLGVNVIELMPINQFEGNISWGYNPALYFATDKAYGPGKAYKAFIDECHRRGIAVVLDLVLNHSFNLSPLVQMYFDQDAGSWGKPLPENPWYLTDCPHEPWCWGNTFDQSSPYTQEFFRRITEYWLTEFRIDGFRLDFTKGFTNQQTGNQGWNYDGTRVAHLKRIANEIWEINPDAYVILEHFTENREERELASEGMLLWGNITYNYQEAAMGWLNNSNFEWISYQNRGWDDPHLIGYMESHDEERIMFKNLQYGNSDGNNYRVQDLTTALERAALAAVFYFPIPGPKMIWQFGELGYDYSINHCADGSIHEGCRTDPKPVRWDYYEDWRRKKLYDIYSLLTNLKTNHEVFRTDDYQLHLDGAMKRIHLNHESNQVTILGNFGVEAGEVVPHFQETGEWHEYFSREQLQVTDVTDPLTLMPGAYRLYSSEPFPDHGIPLNTSLPDQADTGTVRLYPNPASHELHIEATEMIREAMLLDKTGKQIALLFPNDKLVTFQTTNLIPGIYFARIQTSDAITTKRVVIVP